MTPEPEPDNIPRVEAYLDQLLVPLARNLSNFHREELRRELQAHLWGRVDAYRELGQSEDEAVTEALKQFGGASDFVQQWRREWQRTPPKLTLRDVYDGGKLALRPSLLGIATALVPFSLPAIPLVLGHYYTLPWAWLTHAEAVLFWPMTGFSYLALPILVGARQGQGVSVRAGLGMTAVLTAELAAASLLYLLSPTGLSSEPAADSFFSILLTLLFFWLPLAGGAAAISGWWTRRTKARRLA